jgi:hypothetical protein
MNRSEIMDENATHHAEERRSEKQDVGSEHGGRKIKDGAAVRRKGERNGVRSEVKCPRSGVGAGLHHR